MMASRRASFASFNPAISWNLIPPFVIIVSSIALRLTLCCGSPIMYYRIESIVFSLDVLNAILKEMTIIADISIFISNLGSFGSFCRWVVQFLLVEYSFDLLKFPPIAILNSKWTKHIMMMKKNKQHKEKQRTINNKN